MEDLFFTECEGGFLILALKWVYGRCMRHYWLEIELDLCGLTFVSGVPEPLFEIGFDSVYGIVYICVGVDVEKLYVFVFYIFSNFSFASTAYTFFLREFCITLVQFDLDVPVIR